MIDQTWNHSVYPYAPSFFMAISEQNVLRHICCSQRRRHETVILRLPRDTCIVLKTEAACSFEMLVVVCLSVLRRCICPFNHRRDRL
jgi:hypothetical protein